MNKLDELKEHLSDVMELMIKPENDKNYNFLIAENDLKSIIETIRSVIGKDESFTFYHLLNNYFPFETYAPNSFKNETEYKMYFNDYTQFFDYHRNNVINNFIKTYVKYTDRGEQKEKMMKFPDVKGKTIILVENFNLYDMNSQNTMMNHWSLPELLIIGQLRTDIEFAKDHLDVSLYKVPRIT